jgi:hypothetical protein
MATQLKEQIGMEDVIVNDSELEGLLEKRQSLKESVSTYRKTDKEAKEKIAAVENQTPTPFRVGRFLISRRSTPGRTVEFEVGEGSRISIKVIGED